MWILIIALFMITYIWIQEWRERLKRRKDARDGVLLALALRSMNPAMALEILGSIHENGYKLEAMGLDAEDEQACRDYGPWEDVT